MCTEKETLWYEDILEDMIKDKLGILCFVYTRQEYDISCIETDVPNYPPLPKEDLLFDAQRIETLLTNYGLLYKTIYPNDNGLKTLQIKTKDLPLLITLLRLL